MKKSLWIGLGLFVLLALAVLAALAIFGGGDGTPFDYESF